MIAEEKGRKSPRAHVSLVARYRSPTAFEFVEEECSDLSAGGMFIKSPAPAPAGTLLKLECEIDHGAQTLRGVARVVWLREVGSDSQPPGMGVKFVKLEAGGREAIAGILSQYTGELKEPPDAVARRSSMPSATRPSIPAARASGKSASGRPALSGSGRPNGAGVSVAADMASLDEPFAPPRSDPRELARARAEAQTVQAASAAAALEAMGEDAPTLEMPMPEEVVAVLAKERRDDAARAADKSADKAAAKSAAQIPAPAVPPRLPKQAPAVESPSGRPLVYIALIGAVVAGVYGLQSTRVPQKESAAVRVENPAPAPVEAPPAEPAAAGPAPAPAVAIEQAAPPAAIEQPAPPPPTYMLEVATTPNGARISAKGQSATAPGTLELGTLEEPVQVRAEMDGYESASTLVDRVGFMLDEGQMRRRIVLALTQRPPAPAAKPEIPKAAAAKPNASEKPKAARNSEAAAAKASAKHTPAAKATEPVSVVAKETSPTPLPDAPAPAVATPAAKPEKQTPLEAASACLLTADNACVVKALEGKAKSPRELELLIETYRSLGESAKADKQMEAYLVKYPGERRANGYRRMLETRKTEAAASAP